MKTIISIITALFLAIAIPTSAARKHNGDISCPGSAHASKNSSSKKSFSKYHATYHPGKSTKHHSRKQNRSFEKKKMAHRHVSRNTTKHSSVKYKSGGFYSFRRHDYSAHIFH